MSNLEQASKELDRLTKLANTNIDDVPSATRGAWGAEINEAKAILKAKLSQYTESLMQNAVGMFVEGDVGRVQEFTKLVKAENEGVSVDGQALYKRLATYVFETIAERETGVEWGVAQTHRLHLGVQEVMHEVGIDETPMPTYRESLFIKSYEDILNYVERLMFNANGGLLNAMYLRKQASEESRLIRYIGNVVPVLITNALPNETLQIGRLFGKGVSTVKITEEDEINKEFMAKTFKNVNSNLKKTKTKKKETDNEQ